MGAHPNAPSVVLSEKGPIPLDKLIEATPERVVGERCVAAFNSRLPFLFKLLAAARPLSIQAHPDKQQAADGWRRENDAGIPLTAPNRNYRDDNHKPEIMCAITPFRALCGFRPPGEISALLDALDAPCLRNARAALDCGNEGIALRSFFSRLNALSGDEKQELGKHAASKLDALEKTDRANAPLWRLTAELAAIESGDAAVIAPLFLNYIELNPGEAVFLPAGVLHSYVGGFGVELMANSDNVLRGGLTKKHVDLGELLRVLRFEPFRPTILVPEPAQAAGLRCYNAPVSEFRLCALDSRSSRTSAALPSATPSIVVVVAGEFEVRAEGTPRITLKKGESLSSRRAPCRR